MRRILFGILAAALGMLCAALIAGATPAHAAKRKPPVHRVHLVKHPRHLDVVVHVPPSALVKRKPRKRVR